jgi:hypothetical protein
MGGREEEEEEEEEEAQEEEEVRSRYRLYWTHRVNLTYHDTPHHTKASSRGSR